MPTNHGIRIAASDGASPFVMEQPEWDYGRKNRHIQAWPRIGETTILRLRLSD